MNTMLNKRIFKIDIEDKSCPSNNVSLPQYCKEIGYD